MDYNKHYNLLIERARNRELNTYSEQHHIVPRCLGGSDDKENLVRLTPEEHYVAHQLLVKIHPTHHGLVHAAVMMRAGRKGNKLYGWLKRRQSIAAKQRIGDKNGATGSYWVNDGKQSKKIKGDIPEGWSLGRINCHKDQKEIKVRQRKHPVKFCRTCLKQLKGVGDYCILHTPNNKGTPFKGRELELIEAYKRTKSLNKACKELGAPGAVAFWYTHAKEIIRSVPP